MSLCDDCCTRLTLASIFNMFFGLDLSETSWINTDRRDGEDELLRWTRLKLKLIFHLSVVLRERWRKAPEQRQTGALSPFVNNLKTQSRACRCVASARWISRRISTWLNHSLVGAPWTISFSGFRELLQMSAALWTLIVHQFVWRGHK